MNYDNTAILCAGNGALPCLLVAQANDALQWVFMVLMIISVIVAIVSTVLSLISKGKTKRLTLTDVKDALDKVQNVTQSAITLLQDKSDAERPPTRGDDDTKTT